jgi:phage terminase small subunit
MTEDKTRTQVLTTDEGLTAQEESLIQHLLQGVPKSAAGRMAGYKFRDMKRGIDRVLKKPLVVSRIRQLQTEIRNKHEITRDDVLDGFKDAINDAKLAGDPGNQINGWREIAKVLGYYAPEVRKIEVSDKQAKALEQLSQMSEEDLMQIAGKDVIDGEFRLISDE